LYLLWVTVTIEKITYFYHNIREYIDCSLARPACLILVEQLCCQPLLSCGATIRCKANFYCTVFYITLNSNYEAQRASKNLKKIVEDRVNSKKLCIRNMSVFFLLFKGEKYA
jgi:hypothetical protein